MSHSTVNTLHIPTPAMPRGSSLAAALYEALASLFRRTPTRASIAREAAAVRELAFRMQDSDPGFAADLRAAADRHELLQD